MATALPAPGIRRRSAGRLGIEPVAVQIDQRSSPNCGTRRNGLVPRYVVLHYTAMATAEAAIERLCDPAADVSAHYVICKSGRVTQLVGEGMRAWHAGAGEWQGLTDLNSRSIGIELDNDGQGPFTAALMQSLAALLRRIRDAWDIPPQNVIGHSDLAPGRKADPGPWFDWSWLEARGLAAPNTVPPAPDLTLDAFVALARAAGYTSDVDATTLRDAVRLRHRPHASGPLEPADFDALSRH